jgi:hypothetical protein
MLALAHKDSTEAADGDLAADGWVMQVTPTPNLP